MPHRQYIDLLLFCLPQLITIMQNNNLFNILASRILVNYFIIYVVEIYVETLSYNYKLRFIGCDSIQAR